MLNQLPAERRAESCAEPDCRSETTLNEIETARGAGSVRHHEDRDDTKDGIRHAVEQLYGNQTCGVVGQGVEKGAEKDFMRQAGLVLLEDLFLKVPVPSDA